MFSQRIRQLRQERGLTQTEVAEEVHLSMRGYQDLELGRKPKYDTSSTSRIFTAYRWTG